MTSKNLVKVVWTGFCQASFPANYACKLYYDDDSKEMNFVSGWDLVTDKYWKCLSLREKRSLLDMYDSIQIKEDKTGYKLFLSEYEEIQKNK
jgi:hypothetical protein